MASITPQNGRVSFVADWDPHTYWELNSTNLGTNYGDDTSGNDDNTNVSSGDISTQESYDGMNSQNDPPTNGWFDIYLVNDAAALVYIPAGLAHNTVRGLWQNGGGTNSQGAFLRATTTGVEIALAHNNGGDLGDYLIEEIPDADLPGWFCISWQYNSYGGNEGDCALWLNGTAVRSGTRVYTLDYGSGNPDFGDNSGGREPNASQVLDPSSYSGDWAGDGGNINGTGILIANFTCDNPSPGGSDTSPGNGNTWHTDYYDAHVSSGSDTEVSANVDSLTITEQQSTVTKNVDVNTAVDSLTVTEQQATVTKDVNVDSNLSALTVTEQQSSVVFDVEVTSNVDTLVVTEQQASVANDVNVDSNVSALTVSGQQASISVNSDVDVSANVDSLTVTENQASVANDVEISAGALALTVSENQASISLDSNIGASVDALTVTEYLATITKNVNIGSVVDGLALTPRTATLTINANIQATSGSLSVTGQTATIQFAGSKEVNTITRALTVTTYPATFDDPSKHGTKRKIKTTTACAIRKNITTGFRHGQS